MHTHIPITLIFSWHGCNAVRLCFIWYGEQLDGKGMCVCVWAAPEFSYADICNDYMYKAN